MKGENIKIDSSYFEFETPAFIENKDAINCPAYIRFLNLYIKDNYERMVEHGDLPTEKSGKLIPGVEKYKLALKTLKQPMRDVVIFNIIYNDIQDNIMWDNIRKSSDLPMDSLMKLFTDKYSVQN